MPYIRTDIPPIASGEKLSWLDLMIVPPRKISTVAEDGNLQDVGIKVPERDRGETENQRPYSLLLTGQPGIGKSTFALQMCYNLAKQNPPKTSIYISLETTAHSLIEGAKEFGWEDSNLIKECNWASEDSLFENGKCTICGINARPPRDMEDRDRQADDRNREAKEKIKQWDNFENLKKIVQLIENREEENSTHASPDVIVIDSLNVLDDVDQSNEILSFVTSITHDQKKFRPSLVIVIYDGDYILKKPSQWHYICDAEFAFSSKIDENDYYLRKFQIKKMRGQWHAFGLHTLKIKPQGENEPGGVMIFPTVHWHLTHLKRRGFRREIGINKYENFSTPLKNLNILLSDQNDSPTELVKSGGFPGHLTTALIGGRGAMKSHLAYAFLIEHALGGECIESLTKNKRWKTGIGNPKRVLLVSLRDEEDSAIRTLGNILHQEHPEIAKNASDGESVINALSDSNRLSFLCNWHGCITPEEFYHRIYEELSRQETLEPLELVPGTYIGETTATEKNTLVVLNGLDHFNAAFPLCAKERVFIPALFSLFRARGVCAIVLAAEEKSIESHTTDISPIADLVIDFDFVTNEEKQLLDPRSKYVQYSKLTLRRVPYGKIGRCIGFLVRRTDLKMDFILPSSYC